MTKGAHCLMILLMILSFFPIGTAKQKSNKGSLVGQRADGGKRAIERVGSTEPAMYARVRALINQRCKPRWWTGRWAEIAQQMLDIIQIEATTGTVS